MVEDSAPLPGVLSDSLALKEQAARRSEDRPRTDGGHVQGRATWRRGPTDKRSHGQELEVTSQC